MCVLHKPDGDQISALWEVLKGTMGWRCARAREGRTANVHAWHVCVLYVYVCVRVCLRVLVFMRVRECVRAHVHEGTEKGSCVPMGRSIISIPKPHFLAHTHACAYAHTHTHTHTHTHRYLVLDEGHRVKNEDTLISREMRKVARQHVIMLTGGCSPGAGGG